MPKSVSKKPESVKQAAIAKRLAGESKRQIARDLEINRATVDTILDESNVEASLAQWRRDYMNLVPAALKIVKRVLGDATDDGPVEKDKLGAAQQVLKGTGVHEERTRSQSTVKVSHDLTNASDAELNKSISELLDPAKPPAKA